MGLFSNVENDEVETRGSFLSRLRAPRAGFVEPASAAEPQFSPPTKRRAKTRSEARSEAKPAPVAVPTKRGVSFLGRILSADDVEDVESTEFSYRPTSVVPPADATEDRSSTARSPQTVNDLPSAESDVAGKSDPHSMLERQNASYAEAENALRELESEIAKQRGQSSSHSLVQDAVVASSNGKLPDPAPMEVTVPAVPTTSTAQTNVGPIVDEPVAQRSAVPMDAHVASPATRFIPVDETDDRDTELTASMDMPGRSTLVAVCFALWFAAHSFFAGVFVFFVAVYWIKKSIRSALKSDPSSDEAKPQAAPATTAPMTAVESVQQTVVPIKRQYAKSAVVVPLKTGTDS